MTEAKARQRINQLLTWAKEKHGYVDMSNLDALEAAKRQGWLQAVDEMIAILEGEETQSPPRKLIKQTVRSN